MPGDPAVRDAVRLIKRPLDMALVRAGRGKAHHPADRAAGDGRGGDLAMQADSCAIFDHALEPGDGGGAVKIVAHVLLPAPGDLHRGSGQRVRHTGGVNGEISLSAPPEPAAHQHGVDGDLIAG